VENSPTDQNEPKEQKQRRAAGRIVSVQGPVVDCYFEHSNEVPAVR
jgi:hypothetical protein